ncbi:MAG TPA: dihydrolipoamide acetyltransferase family protein [Chloroflexota bacterium]|nr:dihydrolipoamide acetyltransferase family protein [Chloroflexota bacterium]
MATPVTMPMLGLTMEEGTVAEWLKNEGDTVTRDEPLLTVEMDKGTMEVPSPASGVLRRIVVQPGTTVPVKTLIAEIAEPGEVIAPLSAAAATPSGGGAGPGSMPLAGGPGDLPWRGPTNAQIAAAAAASLAGPQHVVAAAATRLFASPRARLRARTLDLDLRGMTGTGPQGRIVEADVLAASTAAAVAEPRLVATPLARRLAQEHGVDIDTVVGTGPGGRITQEDVLLAASSGQPPAVAADTAQPATGGVLPLSRLRRLTAEHMASSAQTTARVTLFLEADFSEAARFRAQLQPEFARLGVPKLPWDALIARAAGLALLEHPALLAQWVDGLGLRSPDAVHVGVAVALEPEGLVVPVLRDASSRSLRELARDLLALAEKARAGRLSPTEMQGGTFTITNLGAYRIDGFTPIVNSPETAILGVGRIAPQAVVIDGQVQARTMCSLSLSFDHRVVDGASAAAFLARLAELLERPYTLLGI